MTQFQLFDSVKLTEPIELSEGGVAPVGTPGAIVEAFDQGEAFLVELFGKWVKITEQQEWINAEPDEPEAFMETIGVELVYPHQLEKQAISSVRDRLLAVLDDLSEELVSEVYDFAEFLKQKQRKTL